MLLFTLIVLNVVLSIWLIIASKATDKSSSINIT